MEKSSSLRILFILLLFSNFSFGQLSALSDEFNGSALDASWNLFQTQFFDIPVPVNGGSMDMASNDANCSPTCVWYHADNAGFIYKTVTGDFDVVTAVSALQKTNPALDIANDTQLTGLMARDPASTSSGFENYVFNVAGIRFDVPSIELKSTLNDNSTIHAYTDNMTTGTKAELRMVREGNIFTLYSRPIGSSTWTLRNSFSRPDLPETLQVGLIAYTFLSYPANLLARFDYVRFDEVKSEYNSASGDWSTAGNWLDNTVPSSSSNVKIPSGVTIDVDVNNAVSNNLEIDSGATLNIEEDAAVTVEGDFDNNGTTTIKSNATNSGVLLIKGTATGNVSYQRGGLIPNQWSIVSAPVSNQTIKDFEANNDIRVNIIPNPDPDIYAIGAYDDAQPVGNKWVYFDDTVNAETFTIGQSYAISTATASSVTFEVGLTVLDLPRTVVPNQWNAIGNPFTAFIPANENSNNNFIKDNTPNFDDAYVAIFVWDNAQNKYNAIPDDGSEAEKSLAPGQGFFVRVKEGITSFNFKEVRRAIQPALGSTFGRSANTTPSVKLFAKKGTITVDTSVKYFSTATKGLDPGYDIGNFDAAFDVFTHLLEDSTEQNFTIQSLPNSDYENMAIPVGIIASAGTEIEFTVEALNLPTGINVYLEDKLTNTFTRLDEANSNYTITLANSSTSIGRFYIHTTSSVLSIDNLDTLDTTSIYMANKGTLRIAGLQQNNTANFRLFNILGKELMNQSFQTDGVKDISLVSSISNGIYIVQIDTQAGSINKKIVIE